MSVSSVQAMRRGRLAADRARRRNAVSRVRAYRRWLAQGSQLRSIPEIPSDHDFKLADTAARRSGGRS